MPQAALRREWLEALADDLADRAKAGVDLLVVSSGAIALGRSVLKLPSGSPQARGKSGRGRRRTDRARPHLDRDACKARPDRRADSAHARRYGGAPSLPQRPLHHRQASRAARRSRHQRERHRRDQRDPLWRQRPPRRPCRHNDERRSARSALRRRRPLRRAARRRTRTPRCIPVVPRVTAEIEAMAGAAGSDLSRGGMRDENRSGENRDRTRAST